MYNGKLFDHIERLKEVNRTKKVVDKNTHKLRPINAFEKGFIDGFFLACRLNKEYQDSLNSNIKNELTYSKENKKNNIMSKMEIL